MSLGTQIKLTVLSLVAASTVYGQKPPADAKPEEVEKEYLALVTQLKDKDVKVRLKAAVDLGGKGEAAASTATALCDAILDTSPRVGEAALVALEKVRADLYKQVSVVILDKDRGRQFQAVAELGALADKALPAKKLLLSRLKAETVTLKCIDDFGRPIGGVSTRRQDSAVLVLMSALEQIDPDNADAHKVRKLLAGVGNNISESRLDAIDALIRWAGEDEVRRKEILPLIGQTLTDNELLIAGINRLAAYGKLSKQYLPTLKKLKLAGAEVVRDAALRAVDAIDDK